MSLTRPLTVLLALTSCLVLAACSFVPNDAGPIPEGWMAEYQILHVPDELFCGSFQDGALVLRDEGDIDEVMASCAEESEGLADFLRGRLESTDEETALIFITVARGGCIQGHDLPVVAVAGDVLRPWLIKDNSSYGKTDVACTADIGEELELLSVYDTGDAVAAELTVGVWNSELPGSPYEEHGLSPQ